jgi:hypothetical protein
MNRRQNAVIDIGIAIVVLLLLFPPWYLVGDWGHSEIKIYHGYHFLLSPPCCGPHIDFARYLAPIGVVCLIAVLACLELKAPRGATG